ncbi:MAG: hypothetical protein Q7R90_04740 [bacterium]|nr:hypothetical protein [bacterium]
MTKELKSLLERAARWPREVQAEAADSLRAIETAYRGLYVLTADDEKALEKSAEDVRLKNFVSKKKLRTFFKSGRT